MRWVGTVIGTLTLAGCAVPSVEEPDWPRDIPMRAYYIRVYEADPDNQTRQTLEDYLVWVRRFYDGYSVAPGWRRSEVQLMKGLTEEQVRLLAPRLAYLGHIMSSEWAKHNEGRNIETNMLSLWGRVMLKAKKDEQLDATLDRLTEDVIALIRGELDPKEITSKRYEPAAHARN